MEKAIIGKYFTSLETAEAYRKQQEKITGREFVILKDTGGKDLIVISKQQLCKKEKYEL